MGRRVCVSFSKQLAGSSVFTIFKFYFRTPYLYVWNNISGGWITVRVTCQLHKALNVFWNERKTRRHSDLNLWKHLYDSCAARVGLIISLSRFSTLCCGSLQQRRMDYSHFNSVSQLTVRVRIPYICRAGKMLHRRAAKQRRRRQPYLSSHCQSHFRLHGARS